MQLQFFNLSVMKRKRRSPTSFLNAADLAGILISVTKHIEAGQVQTCHGGLTAAQLRIGDGCLSYRKLPKQPLKIAQWSDEKRHKHDELCTHAGYSVSDVIRLVKSLKVSGARLIEHIAKISRIAISEEFSEGKYPRWSVSEILTAEFENYLTPRLPTKALDVGWLSYPRSYG